MKFAYNLRQIQIQTRSMREGGRQRKRKRGRELTGRQTNKFSTPLAAAATTT